MGALLRKELREHRWILLLLLVLLALAQAVTLISAREQGSPMAAFRAMVVIMTPLLALMLANRLVVREYMGRTQLFLETLPVSRLQVIGVKWLLGATLLLLAMAACLAIALLAARGKVVLTPHFVTLVALRAAGFVLLMYALAFAIGLTGRYRFLIWGVLVVSCIVADARGQFAFSKWAPIFLVQESMIYERLRLPLRELLISGATALALVCATFALALSAQGSLVVALSRRMSAREKSIVTVILVSLIAAVSMIDVRKDKPLFVLKNAEMSEKGPAIAVGAGSDPGAAQSLANQLAGDMKRLHDFLALAREPALAVLPDKALDADVFQQAALPNADGVVVRAAFDSDGFDRDGFRAYALAAWLRWHAREYASREQRRWLLDGFAQWLTARDQPERQLLLALRAAFALRVLESRQAGSGSVRRQWLSVREQLGTCLADALAWRMVSSLERDVGEQRFQALTRAAFAQRPPNDARAALLAPSLDQLLEQAGAPHGLVLDRQFGAMFAAEQLRLAGSVNLIPLPPVVFKARAMRGTTYEIHYQVGKPGVAEAPFSVRYADLGPWDGELAAETLARVDTAQPGVLPASYLRGARVFTAVERREALLGCSVRIASQRWEVK